MFAPRTLARPLDFDRRSSVDRDSCDRWLGIAVAQLTAWTAHFPWLVSTLNVTYNSLAPQLVVPLVVLPLAGVRKALWEYLWHLHISLIGALICLALWPTVYVFT